MRGSERPFLLDPSHLRQMLCNVGGDIERIKGIVGRCFHRTYVHTILFPIHRTPLLTIFPFTFRCSFYTALLESLRRGERSTKTFEQLGDDGQEPTDGLVSEREEIDISVTVQTESRVRAYVIANSSKWKEARKSSRFLGKRTLNERDRRAVVEWHKAKRIK